MPTFAPPYVRMHAIIADARDNPVVTDGTTAVNQSGVAVITVGGASDNGTGISSAITGNGVAFHVNPIVQDLISVVAEVDIADGAQVILAQPDTPRKLQLRITDANSSITAGTVTFVGIGASGQAVSQAISIANGGTATYVTANAYASITSITVGGLVGAAAGDRISVGPSNALALPAVQGASAFAVFKAVKNSTAEAIGTVDAAAGTIIPTTAPDGTIMFTFWFTFEYTPTQVAHSHTVNNVTAVDAGHTHLQDAHYHVE